MTKQKKLLFYILFYIFVRGFLIILFGNSDMFNVLADVLVFYIAYKVKRKRLVAIKQSIGKPIKYSLYVFFTVGIIASLINAMPIVSLLWGIRMFLRYVVLFCVIYAICDENDAKYAHQKLYYLFNINAVSCLYDFLTGRIGDMMGGIFLGNSSLAVFLVMCVLIYTSDYFSKQISEYRLLFCISISFFIAMVAEIKFLYFVIPLCVYTSYVVMKKFSLFHVSLLVVAYFSLVPLLQYTLSIYYDDEYAEMVFDSEFIEEETTHKNYNLASEHQSFNRGTCVKMAEETFLVDPIHSAIGWGIGSGSNSSSFGTWIHYQFSQTAYFLFTSSYVLSETGWFGYISFLLFYFFVFVHFFSIYLRTKDERIKYYAAIGMTMAGMTFLFIWYNDKPYADYYIVFILWAFCYVAIERRRKLLEINNIQIEAQNDNDDKGTE